jgi:hypothetical protein
VRLGRKQPVGEESEVKCPFCSQGIHEKFELLFAEGLPKAGQHLVALSSPLDAGGAVGVRVRVSWMICPECFQILVLVQRSFYTPKWESVDKAEWQTEEWFAVPQKPAPRIIDSLVPEPYKQDYIEASAILDDSPRMSSVLSRRILQDLLQEFAGYDDYKLEDRIDKFIADAKYPPRLKENLHHLRDMANFSAHTKKDKDTGEIIEVGRDEAEWALDVIDGLFDYFIVSPKKDAERRANWDQRRELTGTTRTNRKAP